ncbi:MAG: hypothetical protein AAFX00_04805 [Pseudomonadota bacterium]
MTAETLDKRLLRAHAEGDKAALVTLYQEAAEAAPDETGRWFYMTHAYVFALEVAHPEASRLRDRLVAAGREG